MPLNTPKLYSAIKKAFDDQKKNTGNQDAAIAKIAKDLSQAIDAYVRSGLVITNPGQQVTVPPGVPVTTVGSQSAQAGATVAPGVGVSSATGTGRVT